MRPAISFNLPPRTISVEAAAAYLGDVPYKRVLKMIRDEKIIGIKEGNSYIVDVASIDRWWDDRMRKAGFDVDDAA